ncbi:MAG TPA: ABC-ATPase UvrA, partial [Nitrospiraceae bacterium]|nr:ABC-ATPase UvrA [Nitrospiraceae bacterium]
MLDYISVKGARVHNLKNIDIKIPRDRLIVITGPSGSGKSSLAFDTIYAEGQRRYVESLSAYARQFLEQLQKPDVDSIEGLSPSIAIEQKTTTKNPRSTIGTITEIYDYLRVLYTRIGIPQCYNCGSSIAAQGMQQIIETVMALPSSSRIQILSPIVIGRKGEYKKELTEATKKGFVRARIDGEIVDLTGEIHLEKRKRHNIEIVIDRLIIKPGIDRRVSDAIELALKHSELVIVNIVDEKRDILFSRRLACPKCGVSYPEINPRFFSFNSQYGACPKCNGLGFEGISEVEEEFPMLRPCPACGGLRLRKEALSIRINKLNIGEFSRLSIKEAITFCEGLRLKEREALVARRILKEIKERLLFLNRVGLGYLNLDRPAFSLSGGEGQRIRLATQIGSSLTGVLYILDEPSIGLHPRDCGKLLDSLCSLREMGNTVIVVEHDEETIKRADYIVDMGPGAGVKGGYVVAEGSLREIQANKQSLTGSYLRGVLSIPIPEKRKKPRGYITILGAQEFNLKNINVKIPLGIFTCITGVSGSGKSTLIFEILYKALVRRLYSSRLIPGKHRGIAGIENIDKVIHIDQSPIGRTPRSNPATYAGIFAFIRELYSQLPDSRVRGYSPGRFSFNVVGGRC